MRRYPLPITKDVNDALQTLRDLPEAQYSKLGGTNDPGSLRVGGSEGRGGAGSLPQCGQLGRGHTTRANALSAGAQRGGAPEFSGEMIGWVLSGFSAGSESQKVDKTNFQKLEKNVENNAKKEPNNGMVGLGAEDHYQVGGWV